MHGNVAHQLVTHYWYIISRPVVVVRCRAFIDELHMLDLDVPVRTKTHKKELSKTRWTIDSSCRKSFKEVINMKSRMGRTAKAYFHILSCKSTSWTKVPGKGTGWRVHCVKRRGESSFCLDIRIEKYKAQSWTSGPGGIVEQWTEYIWMAMSTR